MRTTGEEDAIVYESYREREIDTLLSAWGGGGGGGDVIVYGEARIDERGVYLLIKSRVNGITIRIDNNSQERGREGRGREGRGRRGVEEEGKGRGGGKME